MTTTVTCPTARVSIQLRAERQQSVHATSHGSIAYFRCACRGLVVAGDAADGSWRPFSHAAPTASAPPQVSPAAPAVRLSA